MTFLYKLGDLIGQGIERQAHDIEEVAINVLDKHCGRALYAVSSSLAKWMSCKQPGSAHASEPRVYGAFLYQQSARYRPST